MGTAFAYITASAALQFEARLAALLTLGNSFPQVPAGWLVNRSGVKRAYGYKLFFVAGGILPMLWLLPWILFWVRWDRNVGGIIAPALTGYIADRTHSFALALGITGVVLVAAILSYVLLISKRVDR